MVLFPNENPRQTVGPAKRILTKKKLDTQLVGQSRGAPSSLTMK